MLAKPVGSRCKALVFRIPSVPTSAKRDIRDRTSDGDAIFDVAESLKVAAGQRGGVHQDRKAEGSQLPRQNGIVIEKGLRCHRGNEDHRRDRTNIKPAKIVFAAHIEAAERGNLLRRRIR